MIWMLECLKLCWRFLNLYSFFWIPVSSFCSGWMSMSYFCSKLFIWVLVSFPALLVPCTFFFISLCIAFTFSSILWPYSTISVSILITSVLNCAFDRLSLHCLVLFLELWSVLYQGHIFCFFISVGLLNSKGRSLRYLPGQGNPHCCVVVVHVREGFKGQQIPLLSSWPLSVISSATHKQIGTFWCWFPGGLVCVLSRPLWVFPMNSPVTLGVSPATVPPTGFYSQRFWGFISPSWNPGLCDLSHSPVFLAGCPSACKCRTACSASHFLACSSPPAAALLVVLSPPAACLCPSYWSEWMFLL